MFIVYSSVPLGPLTHLCFLNAYFMYFCYQGGQAGGQYSLIHGEGGVTEAH